MSYRDHFETFERCGLTFAAYTTHDDSMRAPWKEHDGHGDVREIRADPCTGYADKRPGERIIYWDCGRGLAYDWQGTMKKARAEGWGLDDDALAALRGRIAFEAARRESCKRGKLVHDTWANASELAKEYDRAPTKGEITAEALRRDFERLRAWANDEWHYVGVIVELLDVEGNGTDEEESLWGIESDSTDYHAEVARELAEQLADRLNLADAKGRRRKTFKRETAARSEAIRVRA